MPTLTDTVSRNIKRLRLVAVHSIRSLLIPAINIGLSYLFIRLASKELWGEFVNQLIWVTLGAHLLSWGSKEYLLRAFSKNPGDIPAIWQESLSVRMCGILIPLTAFLFLGFSPELLLWTSIWLLGSFLFQSFDVLVLYHRKFTLAIAIEMAGLAIIAAGAWMYRGRIDITLITSLYAVSTLAKSLMMAAGFRQEGLRQFRFRWNATHLTAAIPFFLIGLAGMLQSRIDLYVVNFNLGDEQVAVYQVMINMFIYIQAFSGLVLLPFVRNIYRFKVIDILKLSKRLLLLGILVCLIAIPLSWFILNRLYEFNLEADFFILGAVLSLPVFWYLPVIYVCYKEKKESEVLKINLIGLLVNLFFTLILINPMGIKGALLAATIAQLVILIIYIRIRFRNLKTYADTLPEL